MIIKIKDILGIDIAISDLQANEVVDKINFSEVVILDFEGINDCTTAFLNVIFDSFYLKLDSVNEITDRLKVKNYNDSIKFAWGDAFTLFEERFEK